MAFQPAPGCVAVHLRGTYFGQNIENTLYLKTLDAIVPASLPLIANGVNPWISSNWLGALPLNYMFRELYLRDLTTEDGSEYTSITHQGEPGGNATGLPGGSAFAVKFLTGRTGRSFRGRNFLPVPREQVTGNQVSPALANGIVGAYLDFLSLAGTITGTWEWVVLSRIASGVLRAVAEATPVESVSYSNLDVDSQRRRLSGRGA